MIFKNSGPANQRKKTLHIVSEQKTGVTIEASDIEGEVLVWQDALYEGPLLHNESLMELSMIRADYFSRLGWGEYIEIASLYNQRNRIISGFLQYSEIVLWFDSGLNNQLQLVQLVNWFSTQNTAHAIISIVTRDRLPDVVGFVDFAMLNVRQLEKLLRSRAELTNSQTMLCQRAWRALTAETPTGLLKFFPRDMSSMPYLKNAILRFVQQFPGKTNGLCKTEQLIIYALKTLNDADTSQDQMEKIYLSVQGKEPIPFMSRAIFYAYLQKMIMSPQPIIAKCVLEKTEALEVAEVGDDVIDNEAGAEVVIEEEFQLSLTKVAGQITNSWVDWVQVNGIDRWLGGVHLCDGNIWRYNAEARQLMKTYV